MSQTTDYNDDALTIQSGLIGAPQPTGLLPALQIVRDPLLGLQQTVAGRTEIVFVESNIGSLDVLLQGIAAGKEVYVIDAGQDGLQQMADILAGRSGIDAIHIVSHGQEGAVNFGTTWLNEASVASHTEHLEIIG